MATPNTSIEKTQPEAIITSNEKAQPQTIIVNDDSENLSSSEIDDPAMLALEKRVLRKTDMVVLPMVILQMLLSEDAC